MSKEIEGVNQLRELFGDGYYINWKSKEALIDGDWKLLDAEYIIRRKKK